MAPFLLVQSVNDFSLRSRPTHLLVGGTRWLLVRERHILVRKQGLYERQERLAVHARLPNVRAFSRLDAGQYETVRKVDLGASLGVGVD